MRKIILTDKRFRTPAECEEFSFMGVHTRNGDSIEIHFSLPPRAKGVMEFGYNGGFERVIVKMDFARKRLSLATSEWQRSQPIAKASFSLARKDTHVLRIDKIEGAGDLVKSADVTVLLDGRQVLSAAGVNVLPEIGVVLNMSGLDCAAGRFVHRGARRTIPQYLHVGGWQTLNRESIEANLESFYRGLRVAAEKGVQLLVTPETSLTGLFPHSRVTKDPAPVKRAETKLRKFISRLPNAPYFIAGLPVWEQKAARGRKLTRYNVSRLYDPDGNIVCTHPKVHSCEPEFWHGYKLQEFEVCGVPICMHICHDGRYPELATLPVMFGARLVLHPANGGTVGGSIDALESSARGATKTTHAFYMHVSGGGGSFLTGPQRKTPILAAAIERTRQSQAFPMADPPRECLIDANIRLDDAFGYWPVRSFRASEATAAAYTQLYKSRGGRWAP